jgi:hypothetical protein
VSHHQYLVRGGAAVSLRMLLCIICEAATLKRQCPGAPRGIQRMALDIHEDRRVTRAGAKSAERRPQTRHGHWLVS